MLGVGIDVAKIRSIFGEERGVDSNQHVVRSWFVCHTQAVIECNRLGSHVLDVCLSWVATDYDLSYCQ